MAVFESNVNYTTKLSNFEGPLDLLLHLIKQAEIDIKDIFVSEVTSQFLNYVYNSDIDMETESEYLQIAATIIEIKSKMIIPNEEVNLEAEDEGQALIRRIEEYKLYKESAEKLKSLEDVNRFYKKPDDDAHDYKIVYTDFNVDALIKAFTNLLTRVDIKDTIENAKKEIPKEVFTVADKIYFIRDELTTKKEMSFYELFTDYSTKNEVITTFQAVLELLKLQFLKFTQNETFGDITLLLTDTQWNIDIENIDEYN
ncbi:MAG: segregation/condensation protein A [Clostridia bacterium]|nr:segregation/condensation protein A [Clostridia bacterium]